MKSHILMIVCLALSVAVVGCEKSDGDAKADEAKAEAPAEETEEKSAEGEAEEEPAEEEGAAEDEAPAEKVEVAKGGTKFDPPVEPEQIPEGAWYCDMGTSHWAAMEKPEDGKCPECGMKLKQYDAKKHAEQKEGAVEAKDDHGHEHADEGDDHAHEGDDHDHAH